MSDPIGSAKQVVAGTVAPIEESYRTGGRDEAAARGVPAVLAAVLGGKGLTKLGKAGAAGRHGLETRPVRHGDRLGRLYGANEDRFGTVPTDRYDAEGRPIPQGAAPLGHSWTPVDISELTDARKALGLPRENPARFFIEARVVDPSGMRVRLADPLHGNPGGAPEVVVRDPARQLEITRVEGVNPEP